ncbi:endoribonuclease L-psp family protein [Stipitochalara longipes BDJ]|nr:endoribonuclease L-psp family protein [Stipitochalara longipes BDJ]
MSHLKYYSYEGFGTAMKKEVWYSQAVRVGDRIECSGQGGWDPTTHKISPDFDEEIDQAFANVDLNLRDAGGKGWSQVFRVNIYVTDLNDHKLAASVRNFKKWMPDHQPLFTFVGVSKLGLPEMNVEVEVSAHDEEGAKAAAALRK